MQGTWQQTRYQIPCTLTLIDTDQCSPFNRETKQMTPRPAALSLRDSDTILRQGFDGGVVPLFRKLLWRHLLGQ